MDNNIQSAEPVIIIGLNMDQEDYEYSMEELAALAEANQMEVIDRLTVPTPPPTSVPARLKNCVV